MTAPVGIAATVASLAAMAAHAGRPGVAERRSLRASHWLYHQDGCARAALSFPPRHPMRLYADLLRDAAFARARAWQMLAEGDVDRARAAHRESLDTGAQLRALRPAAEATVPPAGQP